MVVRSRAVTERGEGRADEPCRYLPTAQSYADHQHRSTQVCNHYVTCVRLCAVFCFHLHLFVHISVRKVMFCFVFLQMTNEYRLTESDTPYFGEYSFKPNPNNYFG